jgi:hypothetical protein
MVMLVLKRPRRLFLQNARGYIDTKYKGHYEITADDLRLLIRWVSIIL